MIGQRTVDAHNNGDCWPTSCPVCELEDAYEQCVIDATGRCVRWSHEHEDEMCDACLEGRHAACDNGYIFCDCCGGES